MKTLRSQIVLLFLALIGSSVLVTGIFVSLLLKSSYVDSLTDRLMKEGEMILRTVDWDQLQKDPVQFKKVMGTYQQALNVDITFVSTTGKIIGFTPLQPQKILIAPEVKNALNSKTKKHFIGRGSQFLYDVLPIFKNGKVIGAVYIELNIEEVDDSLNQVWFSLIGGLVVAFLLASFASSRIAARVVRPLEEMTQVATDITKKRFYRRVRRQGKDEVAHLGNAINRMAHHLQKQMDTIRQSERRLSSVVETLESGLLMVDSTGIVRFANGSFEQIFGTAVTVLTGEPYDQLITPVDLSEMIKQCLKEDKKIKKETTIHYPNYRILEVVLTPMWVDQRGISVVVMIHDVTAVRRLEQMRKDFVANVSHELKTPITSIRGFAETLLDGAMDDKETAQEFLEIIHNESIRLQRLVGDLLDLSQIESKQMRLLTDPVSVDETVRSVVKTIEEQAKNRLQTVEINIPEPFTVQMDADGFRQILLNLLSNAMTYTPKGGNIVVSVEKSQEHWKLQVTDTGIGIPQKDIGRIFERFYRVNKDRSRESGGTGLGLAIVKHLVETHNGKVEVESKKGQGSIFRILFPWYPEK